jgi:hypothetical protein
MERLKQMKENLVACVSSQVCGNLHQVDTKELGEAIDMIKDLEEAIYYCTITKAMEEDEQQPQQQHQERWYSTPKMYSPDYNMNGDRMYYDGRDGDWNTSRPRNGHNSSSYPESMNITNYRDMREGSSPMYRKMYMESKEMHHDKAKQMQDLEVYIQELSKDITEMIKEASPEEKQLLQQKIATLASKIK